MSKSSPSTLGNNGSKDFGTTVRLRDLPDTLEDYSPDLLALLCEHKGWNVNDIYHQVAESEEDESEEDEDEVYEEIETRLDQLGIQPDPRPSPTNEPAGTLWRDLDPEDVGLNSSPDDWQYTESVTHQPDTDTYQTAVYDWQRDGGDSQ